MAVKRSGAFMAGRDYDLVWATTEWGTVDRLALGDYASRLRALVESATEGLVTVPSGYPRVYAQRQLFRVRIAGLRSAVMTIDELLAAGVPYARGCLFGHQGGIEVCAANLVDTWQDPETGTLYPSPCALESGGTEPPSPPSRPGLRPEWLPALYIAGAAGAGVALWSIARALHLLPSGRPPAPKAATSRRRSS